MDTILYAKAQTEKVIMKSSTQSRSQCSFSLPCFSIPPFLPKITQVNWMKTILNNLWFSNNKLYFTLKAQIAGMSFRRHKFSRNLRTAHVEKKRFRGKKLSQLTTFVNCGSKHIFTRHYADFEKHREICENLCPRNFMPFR